MEHDNKIIKKLARHIRILNYLLAFFGLLIITGLVIIGFLLYQIITFAQNINQRIENTTNQLDVRGDAQKQICTDKRLGEFLKQNSDICRKSN